jgi:hypothetical protein
VENLHHGLGATTKNENNIDTARLARERERYPPVIGFVACWKVPTNYR